MQFYNPLGFNQQQLQLQLQHIQQLRMLLQLQMQRAQAMRPEISALSAIPPDATNLDRFMASVTPAVDAGYFYEGRQSHHGGGDVYLSYNLGELWDSFGEWSFYGAGVPLVLNGENSVLQYYVPSLSGMQLYVDPRSSFEGTSESARHGKLVFEYFEGEQPYAREPLANKISDLAINFPGLRNFRSSDLLPSSWVSIAWYPIYGLPAVPTLQNLNAPFLTYHSLSTYIRSGGHPQSHIIVGDSAGAPKICLPVLGLVSFKLRGSILAPSGPHECQQETYLFEAADSWIRHVEVYHPDYEFFKTRH